MSKYKDVLIYGFAIFSMFFGSGNLVFPLQIGQIAGYHWFAGFVGLFLTGIILPFLGLFVIKLHKGDYNSFFGEAGPLAKFLLPLFTLSLLGSFGVVPRCITVAHGGIEYIFPQVPLILFSLLFSVICFVFCLKDHLMITILGKWMTPVLLILLAVLILIGIGQNYPLDGTLVDGAMLIGSLSAASYGSTNVSSIGINMGSALTEGFLRGYQTMDLFAAFFFSALIFNQIQNKDENKKKDHKSIIRAALKPSLVGAILLAIVYLGFVFLGAKYRDIAIDTSPALILPKIAVHVMGKGAALTIGIIMIFSCLTSAIALNNIYARYLCSLLKLSNKSFPSMLLATTVVSYVISLLDFRGIAAFLSPSLELSYPSIILLTIMSIFIKKNKELKMVVFYGALGLMLYSQLMS